MRREYFCSGCGALKSWFDAAIVDGANKSSAVHKSVTPFGELPERCRKDV